MHASAVSALISRRFVLASRHGWQDWKASPAPADGDRILVGIRWEGLLRPHRVRGLRVEGGASLLRLEPVELPIGSGWLTLPPRLRVTLGRGRGAVATDCVEIEIEPAPASEGGGIFALFAEIDQDLSALESPAWEVCASEVCTLVTRGPGVPLAIVDDLMPARIPWAVYRVLGAGWSLTGANILHLKVPALKASDGTAQVLQEHILPAEGCGWTEVTPFTVQVHPFVETRPTLVAEHELLDKESIWLVAEAVSDDVFGVASGA